MIKQVINEGVNTEILTDNYDSPWKEAVEHYFPEFMAFYFPDAYAEIDWSKGYDFLDQELRALSQDAELGKRFVDKLVKITDIEEQTKMRYVTTLERFEIEKRFQQGVEQGLVQGEYKLLKKQLEHRFGTLPAWVSDKLSSAGEQDLERWGEAVLNEPTLEDVFNDCIPH